MANDRNARNRTVADPSRSTGAYSINAGDEPPRRRPGWPGLASQVGVTPAEGATQLESQRQHFQVPQGNVKLSA